MLFYKVEGFVVDENIIEKNNDRSTARELVRAVSIKTEEFNQAIQRTDYYFVSSITETLAVVGIISTVDQVEDRLKDYLAKIDLDLRDVRLTETTFQHMRNLLSRADQKDFIEDDYDVCEAFGLEELTHYHGGGMNYNEYLLQEKCGKEELFRLADLYLIKKDLYSELARIHRGSRKSKVEGHPVHYLIRTDDEDTRRDTCRILLQALYENRRIYSKRYCEVEIRAGGMFLQQVYGAVYKSCTGGAVVIRYLVKDDSEDTNYVNGDSEMLQRICEMAKKYRHQVLTIICLERECTKVKSSFYENLGEISIVELQEELARGKAARAFLKRQAEDGNVRGDAALYARLDKEKGYLAAELRKIFDDWYTSKLKLSVYPQYKSVSAVGNAVAKEKPKGSAYEELQAMIGLTEAKKVIQKALDFHKVQKIYKEKGLQDMNPAMHMVFTGNPRTAKTTVARLFAQIMTENGLLSKGEFVEVGRSDLVGKYVGWTAKIVSEKFRRARGGVLFIDEAYSLLESHAGSFGDEAINTIVQEMENLREEVVVIFAGYPDEMEEFLTRNPGLRSRIAFHVPFQDYNAQELCDIAELQVKQKGMRMTEEAMERLRRVFERTCQEADFGNGRYVRNVLERARMNQASRVLSMDYDRVQTADLITIREEDIETTPVSQKIKRKVIGFAS